MAFNVYVKGGALETLGLVSEEGTPDPISLLLFGVIWTVGNIWNPTDSPIVTTWSDCCAAPTTVWSSADSAVLTVWSDV